MHVCAWLFVWKSLCVFSVSMCLCLFANGNIDLSCVPSMLLVSIFTCSSVPHSPICLISQLWVTYSCVLVESMKDITQQLIYHDKAIQHAARPFKIGGMPVLFS